MNAVDLIKKVNALESDYADRNAQFSLWFDMLDQVDFNAKEDLESFVANDSRTLWNMSTFLLQPKPLVHSVIRKDGMPFAAEGQLAAKMVERLLARQWERKNKDYRKRGGSGWIRDFIGNLLATGWFAIPMGVDENRGLFVEFIEPHSVYPEWSDDDEDNGLLSLGRKWTVGYRAAKRMARRQGWELGDITPTQNSNVTFYQYWSDEGDGVFMGVAVGTTQNQRMVRNWEEEEGLEEFGIPWLVGGVGGLPLSAAMGTRGVGLSATAQNSAGTAAGGTIDRDTSTTARAVRRSKRTVMGQSIFASNERVMDQFNKTMGMLQQILSDTAYVKTYEKNAGKKILRDTDNFFKRGFHVAMEIGEEFGTVGMQGIPGELETSLISMRNMLQRGGLSDVTFGQLAGDITAVLMSQATGAAQQLLSPYQEGAEYVFTATSNRWLLALLDKPGFFKKLGQITEGEKDALVSLKDIADEIEVVASYSIQIPGDLVQRITTAKMASKDFDLAPIDTYRLFVPEISDPEAAIARLKKAQAENGPEFRAVQTMRAFKQASDRLKKIDPQTSAVYRQIAAQMQGVLTGRAPVPNNSPSPQGGPVPQQALPPGPPQGPPQLAPAGISQEAPIDPTATA